MNAFLKAGTDLDRDIYPKMKYRKLYMPEETGSKAVEEEKNQDLVSNSDQIT